MQTLQWISRTFHFDFPAGMFNIIVARLRGTYPQIHHATQHLPSHVLTQRAEDKWSIQQHIGHLTDLEDLHLQRLYDFRAKKDILSAWDGLNTKTETAGHNEKNIERVLEEMKTHRNTFLQELLKFSDAELEQTALHPRLNVKMRIVDLAYFVAEHDDHHIAAMYDLIKIIK